MQNSLVAILGVATMLALPGVAHSVPDGPEGVEWRLLKLGEAPVPILPGKRQPSLLLDPAGKRATGFTGCNNFFTSYELAGASLKFGPVGTTRRTCADLDPTVEPKYLEALTGTHGWRIEGVDLLLTNDDRVLARLVRPAPGYPIPGLETLSLHSKVYPAGPAVLTRGEFRAPAAPGSASRVTIRLTDKKAFATLAGNEFGAVAVATSLGGSGSFYELALLSRRTGTWVNTDTVLLGDRVKLRSVAIERNVVVVAVTVHGPGDPRCCPTVEVEKRFAIEGERLVPVNDRPLATQATLTGTVWQWAHTRYNNDKRTAPAKPENYTIRFLDGGLIDVKADCNLKGGRYSAEGARLSITIINSTMAMCEPDSLEEEFVRNLTAGAVYFLRDGDLYVDLKFDTGTMKFSRQP